MANQKSQKDIRNILEIALILLFCALTLVLDFVKITIIPHELRNKYLSKIIQQGCGVCSAILLMRRLDIRLFGKPQNPTKRT